MTDLAISIEGLGKKYRLFRSPAERMRAALHPFRRSAPAVFRALQDVSIAVPHGQTVGILGRNGSGKSTLLQIIAGVTQPSEGVLRTDGRISALLELGAGFNPEFTGRDNAFVNGSILGFSRAEMQRRMPEIESFADIGDFFDRPVKTYSSGMFVRVAFAVAISVDPDILIVDEALAVGDAKFQHKCFQKFVRFKEQGRTILVVTHSPQIVTQHCDRGILLEGGRVVYDGAPMAAVDRYFDLLFGDANPDRAEAPGGPVGPVRKADSEAVQRTLDAEGDDLDEALPADFRDTTQVADLCHTRSCYNPNEIRFGNGQARIIDAIILTPRGYEQPVLGLDDELQLMVKVSFEDQVASPVVGFSIKSLDGVHIYGTNTGSGLMYIPTSEAYPGEIHFYEFTFKNSLAPGDYFVDVGLAEDDGTLAGRVIEVRRSVCHFAVAPQRRVDFTGFVNLFPRFRRLAKVSSLAATVDA